MTSVKTTRAMNAGSTKLELARGSPMSSGLGEGSLLGVVAPSREGPAGYRPLSDMCFTLHRDLHRLGAKRSNTKTGQGEEKQNGAGRVGRRRRVAF